MHTDRIVPQQWMLVSREIREHLAVAFHVGKSGITEVHNEQVVTDGRTNEDLAGITAQSMAEYTGYGADYFEKPHPEDQIAPSFGRLWELTIAKARSELNPPVGMVAAPGTTLEVVDGIAVIVPPAPSVDVLTPPSTAPVADQQTPIVPKAKKTPAEVAEARKAGLAKAQAALAAKRAAAKAAKEAPAA